MPHILNKAYYERKEIIVRPLLTNLIKKRHLEGSQKLELDHSEISRASTLRKNKVLLEEIVRERQHENWITETQQLI